MRRSTLLAAATALLAAPSAAQHLTVPEIAPADLRARVGILADDSMQGRQTGSPGLERATAYVVGELSRLGLRAAGIGGYRVPVELERRTATVAARVVAHGRARELGGDQVVLLSGSSGFPPAPKPGGEGEIVYGGYLADTVPLPPEEMSNERLAGAVLLLQVGSAANIPAAPRYSLPSLAGPFSPLSAILLITDDTANWAYLQGLRRSGAVSRPLPGGRAAPGPAVFAITRAEAERIAGRPLAREHQPIRGLGTFRYAVDERRVPLQAANVAAVLPGRDSVLAREYVVLGAHLDHLGAGVAVDGDSINNGADDDASGSAVLLEVAEQLAALPPADRPARSILFVWHTAEEEGMLGSRAFSERPTVPRSAMVAMLNLDMVARNASDSLFVIGSRRLSTALGDALERANAEMPRPFALDYSLDAADHPERLYCRSDHHSYARFMIPVAYLTGGLHADYHRPSDEAGRLDYAKLARVGDLVSRLARGLSAMPARPAVDHPPPPLGTECS